MIAAQARLLAVHGLMAALDLAPLTSAKLTIGFHAYLHGELVRQFWVRDVQPGSTPIFVYAFCVILIFYYPLLYSRTS